MIKPFVGLLMACAAALGAQAPARAVLVTGATSGIGRKITERLSSNGYFVYAGFRTAAEAASLESLKNVQPLKLDVTSPGDIASAVSTVSKAGRGLYGVVNNAGVLVVAPLIEADEKQLDYIFGVNLYGPIRITKAFAPPFGVRVSLVEPGNYGTSIGRTAISRTDTANLAVSRFAQQVRSLLRGLESFENNPPPDDVADAVLASLNSANPKPRYLVVPVQNQADIVLRKLFSEIAELNNDQKFSRDREALVKMLDDALARVKRQ